MEGMPRFPMFAPECKLAHSAFEDIGFKDKLFMYIRSHYGQDPSEFENSMDELLKMRDTIMHPYPSEDLIPIMKKYYAQLLLLSNQFPLDGGNNDLQITYSWYDRLHDPQNVLHQTDIQFEIANVLYNLAAIHAQIGAELPRENDEGIKKAFTHFGYAAYPLQVLRDEMNGARFPTLDFDRDTTTFYLNVIMGQAQECMVEKSLVESRKPLVIARLTAHLQDIYMKCYDHLAHCPIPDIISVVKYKEWCRMCSIKSDVYAAISMLYQGIEAEQNERYGERLAFYEAALSYMTTAREALSRETRRGYLETAAFVEDVVTAKYNNAKKENDFIYHARVPKSEDISLAEPLSMACAYSFNPLDPSVAGPELFRGLVPPTVIKASSEYDEKKAELKRSILEKSHAYDAELNTFLERIDLSRLIRMIKNPYGSGYSADGRPSMFPEDLLSANSFFSVQNRDAVPEVLEQLRVIGDKARDTDSLLNSLISRIDSIVDVPQLSSDEGVKAIREECTKLLETSAQAKKANMNLRETLNDRMEPLQTLGLSLEELIRMMTPNEQKNYATVPSGSRLIELGDKVEEMMNQRRILLDKIDDEFKKDDINGKLLIERDTNHEQLFEKELKKYDQLISLLDQNLSAQPRVLSAVLDANAEFADNRKEMSEEAEKRNCRIVELVSASDEYFRVVAEVEQAGLFYDKLSSRVNKLETAVDGIENAFSDIKRAHDEKRAASERKLLEDRAARDARAAIDDFSIPTVSSINGGAHRTVIPRTTTEGSNGGRRRLGDYMQYYRDKMGGSSGPTPPSPSTVSHRLPYTPSSINPVPSNLPLLFVSHSTPYTESVGAPSPAPSTISNQSYAPSTVSNIPYAPSTVSNQPYPPPNAPTPQYFPTPVPNQQYAPPPTVSHQQYTTPIVPNKQCTPTVSNQQYAPPPTVSNPQYAAPTVSNEQYTQPPTVSNVQYVPPPNASYGIPSSLSSNYTTPSQYSHPPSIPPSNQHGYPSYNKLSSIPSSLYTTPSQTTPVTNSNLSQPPQFGTMPNPAPYGAPPTVPSIPPSQSGCIPPQPPSQCVQPPSIPSSSQSSIPSHIPLSNVQYPSSTTVPPSYNQSIGYNGIGGMIQPPSSINSPWLQYGQAPIAAPTTRNQPSTNTIPTNPIIEEKKGNTTNQIESQTSIPKLPSLADLSAQLRNGDKSTNPPSQSSTVPPPSIIGAPSPWHRGLQSNTVYGGMQPQFQWGAPMSGPSPSPQPMMNNMNNPLAQGMPSTTVSQHPPTVTPIQPAPVVQQKNETLDLLSDIFSSSNGGGPSLQPTTIQRENIEHTTHAAPSTVSLATPTPIPTVSPVQSVDESITPSPVVSTPSTTVIRPAATVLPMQQQSIVVVPVVDEQVLSLSRATSVGYAPSSTQINESVQSNTINTNGNDMNNGNDNGIVKANQKSSTIPLESLTNVETFDIGIGDGKKLAKKQLHASIREGIEGPSLDPNDPLNMIDPFWKTK